MAGVPLEGRGRSGCGRGRSGSTRCGWACRAPWRASANSSGTSSPGRAAGLSLPGGAARRRRAPGRRRRRLQTGPVSPPGELSPRGSKPGRASGTFGRASARAGARAGAARDAAPPPRRGEERGWALGATKRAPASSGLYTLPLTQMVSGRRAADSARADEPRPVALLGGHDNLTYMFASYDSFDGTCLAFYATTLHEDAVYVVAPGKVP